MNRYESSTFMNTASTIDAEEEHINDDVKDVQMMMEM